MKALNNDMSTSYISSQHLPSSFEVVPKSMRGIFKFEDDLVQIYTSAIGLRASQTAELVA
jgi:hypothetical protein